MAKNSPANNGGGKVTAPDIVLATSVGTTDSYVACSEPLVADFLAGQHMLAGQVTVANDDEFLYVTYATSDGWVFGKTHLYVGPQELLPVNKKGNPKIGNFPNSITHEPLADEYTYVFELDDLGECFIVAAHAEVYLLGGQGEVIQQETAWADGNQINESGSWATYADYCLQECNACEFVPEVFDLFGGQTILIGNVSVTNDDENLYVTYNTEEDWYIRETHLYVGTLEDLPVNGASTPVCYRKVNMHHFRKLRM